MIYPCALTTISITCMAWCAIRATVIGKCTITSIKENYFSDETETNYSDRWLCSHWYDRKNLVAEYKVRLMPTENACVVLLSISIQSVCLFCVTASGLVRLPLKLAVHHPLLANWVVTRPQQGFCCVRVVRLLQTLARVFMPDWAVLWTEYHTCFNIELLLNI